MAATLELCAHFWGGDVGCINKTQAHIALECRVCYVEFFHRPVLLLHNASRCLLALFLCLCKLQEPADIKRSVAF